MCEDQDIHRSAEQCLSETERRRKSPGCWWSISEAADAKYESNLSYLNNCSSIISCCLSDMFHETASGIHVPFYHILMSNGQRSAWFLDLPQGRVSCGCQRVHNVSPALHYLSQHCQSRATDHQPRSDIFSTFCHS